ncbi:MAG: protein-disulfide reductase DsbD [Bermanella sp.]
MHRILILLSAMLLSTLSYGEDEQFLPVEQAFPYTIQYQQDGSALKIDWQIADHYYLYLDRLKLKQGDKRIALNYEQDAIMKEDEYFGRVGIFKHQLNASANIDPLLPFTFTFQGCAEAGLCYPPVKTTITPPGAEQTQASDIIKVADTTAAVPPKKLDSNDVSSITALLQESNIFWQLLIFFGLGIGLAFTPCVFPMVPILSSIIVGQGDNLSTRKAFMMSLTYVLAMAMTYALAGVVVGYFGAKANVSLYLQSPWVLGTFAAVFVGLSLSMFGFYELQLPRAIQDKLNSWNQKQQGGQLLSVGIMGSLSALVVSPCVSAPLAGTLVYISTTGDALLGGAALLALGLGMGLPLLLIGTGGSKFLPKAGMWMNAVKAVFGVALLAVAIWLLERVIPAMATMMLWAILLIASGTYLGAFENNTQGWHRLFKALGLVFSLYGVMLMVGGAAGNHNPLKPLQGLNNSMANGQTYEARPLKKQIITTAAQLQASLNQAQQENKIAVLDFYADWCIACKIMEEEIFNQANVKTAMADVAFIQMDITDNTDEQLQMLSDMGLFGPPAVLFYKGNVEQKALRIVGEVPAETFLSQLQASQYSL